MKFTTPNGTASLFLFVVLVTGCGDPTATKPGAGDNAKNPSEAAVGANGEQKSHAHDGWWCDEHGVPEGECGQCNAKLAAEFKKKGDWCNEHDRPDSQCFVCHPELEAKFAARYAAKFGKQPRKPE
jgi:cobalt-zinc-cadmium efflux system membrane fusion protein